MVNERSRMRYLYGDSAPFPYGFDFLATLDRFLEESLKIVRADTEMHELVRRAEASAAARSQALLAVEALHVSATKLLEEGGMRLGGELAPEYAGRVVESAGRAMDDARRVVATRAELEEQALAREIERRHEDVRTALEAFFVLARLPLLAATFRMELVDGRAVMNADLVHPEGIVASLALAADRVAEWQSPRRAGDFVPDLELLVGMKRGLLSREERLEPVRLDDYSIGGFMLAEDTAQIRLRRRVTDADAYVFDARLEQGRLVAEVTRPLESGERQLPTAVEESDRQKILSLWEHLRRAVEGPLDRRERLVSLLLDQDDVFETGRYVPLVERLIKSFSHTVAEIARRSPHHEELSLKRESDSGGREEIYLKKRDLALRLRALSPAERALFAPLGLSDDAGDVSA
jgi:hypothetical protein